MSLSNMHANQLKTVSHLIELGSKQFSSAGLFYHHGTDNSYDEALILVAYVLNINLLETSLDMDMVLTNEQQKQIISFFEHRISKKIPASYLTNIAYFGGRKFYIDERAMIPTSPFAEIINNKFSPWINKEPNTVLELCTGSGALAISIAHEFANCMVTAIDISKDALDVAQKNIDMHNIFSRVKLINSDLFANVKGAYDLIVSNPPYVDVLEYHDLPKEYTYEPRLAFIADNHGLAIVEKILQQASSFLVDNGMIFIEIGSYARKLEEYFPKIPFTWIELYNGGEGIFMMTKEELDNYFG